MEVPDESARGVVELELALLAQPHDAGGGEALRVRGDAEAVAGRQRHSAGEIGMAETLLEQDAPALGDRDRAARQLARPHLKLEPAGDIVESGAAPSAPGIMLLGGTGKRRPASTSAWAVWRARTASV